MAEDDGERFFRGVLVAAALALICWLIIYVIVRVVADV